jgi:hypothetical protein
VLLFGAGVLLSGYAYRGQKVRPAIEMFVRFSCCITSPY